MSLVTVPASESILQSIDLSLISVGLQTVLDEVLPLLSSDASWDAPALEELRRCMKRFAQAVGFIFMGITHAGSGTQTTAMTLVAWNRESPSSRLAHMVSISEGFLLADLNIDDAQIALREVKASLKLLFDQFTLKHGPDVVVKIVSLKNDGHVNVENVVLHTLASRVIRSLEETEAIICGLYAWLKRLQEWLQSFLQDEKASLKENLEDNPFWSQYDIEKWQILRTQMHETDNQLLYILDKNPDWFAESKLTMEQDKAARQHTFQVPVPQIVVPADPDPSRRYTTIPHRAFFESMGKRTIARFCSVNVQGIDPAGNGVSSIKLRFSGGIDDKEPLHGINIRCQYSTLDSGPPATLKEYHPHGALDLRNDDVKPPGCRTRLKVVQSGSTSIEWRFSPFRFWHRNTIDELPLNFPFSLNIEHSTDLSLTVEVTIYRCNWIIIKRRLNQYNTTLTIRAPSPASGPETASDLALIKPTITT